MPLESKAELNLTPEAKQKTTQIKSLPNPLLRIIVSHSKNQDANSFAKASHLFYKVIKPNLDIQKLSQHIVYGEMDEAEKMIKANPQLLLMQGSVIDYSGRAIEGTPFQMALGAEDVAFQDDEIGMVEMIQQNLSMLDDGEKIIARQYRAQFPDDFEENEKIRQTNDLEALNKVFTAIKESKAEEAKQLAEDCRNALEEFREYLKPKNVIKNGKHFNAEMLLRAFELYDYNYYGFGSYDSPKNNMLLRQVVGYVQRFLPACYAQVFCQGLKNIVLNNEKFRRCLRLPDQPNISIFPLDLNPNYRLGFGFVATANALALDVSMPGETGSQLFSKLISSKNIHIAHCYAPAHDQSKRRRLA